MLSLNQKKMQRQTSLKKDEVSSTSIKTYVTVYRIPGSTRA